MEYRDSYNEWLHTVAHDLKTPINAVRGCIELVQHAGPLNEQQQHFTTRAMAGLQRMEHLVSRLLDLSWVDADAPLDASDTNLTALVHTAVDVLKEMAEQHSVTVNVELNGSHATILADSQRLAQVMDNLLSNAIKYNRNGGEVTISAAYEPDFVKVSVRDTGIGISEEDQEHVFERFFRSKEGVRRKIEGSGLGLAITRGIVEKHHGRIWLESRVEEGTTFFFTLPLRVEAPEGDDSHDEMIGQNLGEGDETQLSHDADLASEERDVINDNFQENREVTQVDSSVDDV